MITAKWEKLSSIRKVRIMRHFATRRGLMRCIDVANDLKMSRQIANYTLKSLVDEGFLEMEGSHYSISQKGYNLMK